MSAMLEYNAEASLKENQANMEENMTTVASGEVTHAIRDTKIDGMEIVPRGRMSSTPRHRLSHADEHHRRHTLM